MNITFSELIGCLQSSSALCEVQASSRWAASKLAEATQYHRVSFTNRKGKRSHCASVPVMVVKIVCSPSTLVTIHLRIMSILSIFCCPLVTSTSPTGLLVKICEQYFSSGNRDHRGVSFNEPTLLHITLDIRLPRMFVNSQHHQILLQSLLSTNTSTSLRLHSHTTTLLKPSLPRRSKGRRNPNLNRSIVLPTFLPDNPLIDRPNLIHIPFTLRLYADSVCAHFSSLRSVQGERYLLALEGSEYLYSTPPASSGLPNNLLVL